MTLNEPVKQPMTMLCERPAIAAIHFACGWLGPLPATFTDLGDEIADFTDTAAIMANLDLVISSCTGPAHLAGALARPIWTMLPFSPDWRWMESGVCTPWYPTMRLFRQDRLGDWTQMVDRVRAALHDLVSAVG